MFARIVFCVSALGSFYCKYIPELGRFILFIFRIFTSVGRPFYMKNFLDQIFVVAFTSLPIISLTALFTGAVLALQTYSGFNRFGATDSVSPVVLLSITRELGPVLTGLMICGRSASSIAAELGSMVVGNQIASMRLLSVDPFKFLLLPRMLACILALPFLTAIFDIVGFLGSYLVCVYVFDFVSINYINYGFAVVEGVDFAMGMVKAVFFGIAIAAIGCYTGYNTHDGSHGIGIATTKAVVVSSVSVLLLNYILTAILF